VVIYKPLGRAASSRWRVFLAQPIDCCDDVGPVQHLEHGLKRRCLAPRSRLDIISQNSLSLFHGGKYQFLIGHRLRVSFFRPACIAPARLPFRGCGRIAAAASAFLTRSRRSNRSRYSASSELSNEMVCSLGECDEYLITNQQYFQKSPLNQRIDSLHNRNESR
jgi:hypothetical protein